MKRRRISPIMIAGVLALLSALGLIALISSGGVFTNIDPTAQQQTVNAIVRTRLTQTTEMRATQPAVLETATLDPILRTATELVIQATETDAHPGTMTPD